MSSDNKQGGNIFAIGIMFALFFMIAFVTNFAGSMGIKAIRHNNATKSNQPYISFIDSNRDWT